MDLLEFKDRLAKQGVSYELFCERYDGRGEVESFISQMVDFTVALGVAFDWRETPEGDEYWSRVARERNEEKCSLGEIVTIS